MADRTRRRGCGGRSIEGGRGRGRSNAELLRLALGGDTDAFTQFMGRHGARLGGWTGFCAGTAARQVAHECGQARIAAAKKRREPEKGHG